MKKLIPFAVIFFANCHFLFSQVENTNKLPVVNLEITSVSGEDFVAPVWLKFDPSGTYDPDGRIVKFELDFNSDGIYEVSNSTMQVATFEFTEPGLYTTSVKVTDDNGGVTRLTKTIDIAENRIPEEAEEVGIPVPVEQQIEEPAKELEESVRKDTQSGENNDKDNTLRKMNPLTTDRMYHPDSIIKSGRWGNVLTIQETESFAKFETNYMEPGIEWSKGMFTSPDYKATEMIYYHDGSKAELSGYVTILNCLDYCGNQGDCEFIIKKNGAEIWNSGIVKHKDEPKSFTVSLEGVSELRLIVTNGGDNTNEDWAAWLELNVSKSSKKKIKKVTAENILYNGSFEEGEKVNGYKTLKKGEKIPGWTVINGDVDLTGSYFVASDGKISLDLHGTPGFGGIQQRFFTEKGKKYLLTFDLAGNPQGGPTIKKLLVSFGDQTVELEFDITGKTARNMGWETKQLVFRAKERATILKFESNHLNGPANYGPAIDNVILVPYSKKKHQNKVTYVNDDSDVSLFGFDYGVVAGASLYFMTDKAIERLTNYNRNRYSLNTDGSTLGYHFGLVSQVNIWRILLRPELVFQFTPINYQIKDLSISNNDLKVRQNLFFLDIPVLLGYQHNNFRFMAGPAGHLFIGKSKQLSDMINNNKDFRSFTLSFQLGVGYDISAFSVDLRYAGFGRFLGDGLEFGATRVYFTDTPNNIVLSFSYKL